ncbi:MAG TPA: tyrosine-type recombinase/integrase [Thermoanaerobaculia bacterium]|nr:tyrosine-type recombinase/integrase [Thermoanaerobaculia bacterium]
MLVTLLAAIGAAYQLENDSSGGRDRTKESFGLNAVGLQQLRALYEWMPDYERRVVQFDAHTGLRSPSELLQMTWRRVNWDRPSYRPDPRFAKFGKEREVPLNDVALEILKAIRPANVERDAPVWLKPNGKPLKSFRMSFDAAVRKVCPTPDPGWRYPTIHSLRDSCASAIESVSSKAVVAFVLGHGPRDVTDLYTRKSFEVALGAIRRAALLIDGEETPENVVVLGSSETKTAKKTENDSISA